MKKIVLGISMSLAVLAFLAPPAAAAGGSHGAPALSDFLASLAPAPVTVAKRPGIHEKSLCAAAANCVGGGTVSCSSNTSTSSCTAVDYNCAVGEPGHVTCDGVTTWCANTCPPDCEELEIECGNSCYPCAVKTFQCSPYRCRCDFATCPV